MSERTNTAVQPKPLNVLTRGVLIVAGTISLAVGIVGAFVPVLPTTPFILLAAFCYLRSSQKLYARLMRSRFANKHVHGVLAGHGIALSIKIISLTISAVMIGYVSVFVAESFVVRMLLGLLYLVQVGFMLKIKTLRGTETHEPKFSATTTSLQDERS